MTERTRVSVVVISAHGEAEVARSLVAVRSQCERHGATLVVVVRNHERGVEADGEHEHVIRASVGDGLAQRRAAGLAHASGDWVAMTETPVVPTHDWLFRLLDGVTATDAVRGGAVGVVQAADALDLGAYFAEYGIYGATGRVSQPNGTPHLAAANVAYHRRVLSEVIEV